jgi:hypothetical protein
VLAALRRRNDAVGVVFVAVEDEDGVEIGPPHQGEEIVVAIGIRYSIPVTNRSQQPGRDITDGLDPKPIAEGLQDGEMDDLRDLTEPDDSDVDLLHWPSPHHPCRFEPTHSFPQPA